MRDERTANDDENDGDDKMKSMMTMMMVVMMMKMMTKMMTMMMMIMMIMMMMITTMMTMLMLPTTTTMTSTTTIFLFGPWNDALCASSKHEEEIFMTDKKSADSHLDMGAVSSIKRPASEPELVAKVQDAAQLTGPH